MKKLFISCPMSGRSNEAIKDSMARMRMIAEAYIGEPLEAIKSFIEYDQVFSSDCPPYAERMWHLGESIKLIALADVFIGCDICSDIYPGCSVEATAANKYGLHTIILDESEVFMLMPDVKKAVTEFRMCMKYAEEHRNEHYR